MKNRSQPLADLLRPQKLEDIVEIETSSLRDLKSSLIFWGPPGCGKTSCARILAKTSFYPLFSISAVTGTAQQFREIFQKAEASGPVVLLIDEIHHLNKSQQDLFLSHLENGHVILVGTTTENPSFELRPALLSRCKVIVCHQLTETSLELLLQRAESFTQRTLPITKEAKSALCSMAAGDGRFLLNMVEDILNHPPSKTPLDTQQLTHIIGKRFHNYDKKGDYHYNLISALHKSMRGSDVNAALYWLSRMLHSGEDPLYILRRIVRFASEDVGMADPQALVVAVHAQQAYTFLGSPEGDLAIAHAAIYMATAPKSNSVYKAFNMASISAKQGDFPPPQHILNAPTQLMKDIGYSEGYLYDHDQPDAFSGQNYFPDKMERQIFYIPANRGFEREIKKRLDWWDNLRKKRSIK